MEAMSQPIQSDAVRLIFCKHALGTLSRPRVTRLHVWFISAFSSIFLWMCFSYFIISGHRFFFLDLPFKNFSRSTPSPSYLPHPTPPRSFPPQRNYKSNGFLKVSCNGGLNQMRAAICDMVTVARLLNLTLVVPELDKTSFWRDPSEFDEIFDVNHFIASLRDEVKIVRKLPRKYTEKNGYKPLEMPPVSWSDHTYYLKQILPLFNKTKVLHFNKTDARLANNGIPRDLQRLRCRVNFHALKFTDEIESLGNELVRILRRKGRFVALHLRYEMDMLAFSGCTKGCSNEEAENLKSLRYAFPWWREKEINSDERRSMGLCPLTPEETALVLHALGFAKGTPIYIAAGEIYGGEKRMRALTSSFPKLIRKEMLLDPSKLENVRNHSTRMAALDFMVSNASNVFISTYDGNMARLVEGHRRYYGFKRTVSLDRRKLVQLLDMQMNGTLTWNEFAKAVRSAHATRTGEPVGRASLAERPKEEEYFYANPVECLCEGGQCS